MAACPSCGKENPEGFQFCGFCTAPLTGESREQRKTVTVLFCDVTGSTALGESTDPEALRALLARYFERMKAIVESHGGTVEKFIGDAVMAVFGVPVAHEDDALRAVRAASEMRDALPELGIRGRIGVNTGEVVTGTEERLATGDAVNVAARLEQAAGPGEVLLGDETIRLVEDAVEVEPMEPLELKGKREPVPAFRLVRVGEAAERLHVGLFVGRERELDEIEAAWVRAGGDQRCELVTIVAEAGVGKTRLAEEALAGLGVRVVRGRCLSYGEGITYWPIVDVVKQLGARPSDPAAAAAIASLLGESEVGTTTEEIAWAFRKLLEEQAPLVCLFEDIHWGEETFLDLIEHVALLSAGSQLLLLCTARPELLERRHSWTVTVRLAPLEASDVDQLMPASLPAEVRERIARAAGGNPLFVTEMVAMAETASGEVSVPPTLRALLTARLDHVDADDRRVLERGAVEGEVFHRGAVQALTPDEAHLTARLASLVRREFIHPDQAQIAGEDGFRFRHLLIRDAAYSALPKARRAELHASLADWLDEQVPEQVGLDEIVGYHLEQACRYRSELGLPLDGALATRARRTLTDAGRRAFMRQDYAAAVSRLQRAAALVPPDAVDIGLEIDLADALYLAGRGEGACASALAAAERAEAVGDSAARLAAQIELLHIRLSVDPEGAADELISAVSDALPLLQAAGNDIALQVAYQALGHAAHQHGRMDEEIDANDRALLHARRTGLAHYEASILPSLAIAHFRGTTAVTGVLAWLDEQERSGISHWSYREIRALALTLLGNFGEARELLTGLREELADRGAVLPLALTTARGAAHMELLADDAAAAVEFGEEGCRLLEVAGERSWLSTAAATLAQALYALGRFEDANAWSGRSMQLGATDDLLTQILWRQVKAKLLAQQAAHAEANRLAREALAIAETTDMLNVQGDAYSDAAEVLVLAGKTEEAASAIEHARGLYARKGNLVMADRSRKRLIELRPATHRDETMCPGSVDS